MLPGFGTFEVRDHDPRTGHNPKTGEEPKIAASRVPALKPFVGCLAESSSDRPEISVHHFTVEATSPPI